jgi:hypothetical protein
MMTIIAVFVRRACVLTLVKRVFTNLNAANNVQKLNITIYITKRRFLCQHRLYPNLMSDNPSAARQDRVGIAIT